MKIYLSIFLLACVLSLKGQNQPIKWATQETFFADLVGKSLPGFVGNTSSGKIFLSKELKNKVVVINFWFEECPPCVEEMPELNQLVKRHNNKNILFIGLTTDLPQKAKRFQQRNGYQYQVISLSPDAVRKLNINHGFPSNILVGRDGKIRYAMANISFEKDAYKDKSIIFEEKLKAALKEFNE